MLRHKLFRAETKILDAKTGRVSAVVSTETADRDGDIIRVAGWNLDNFMKHPVLLANHSYRSIQAQIGEWEDMKVVKTRKSLEGVARYYINEGNADADWGFNLASKGRAAFSVGFIPDMEKASPLGDKGDFWGPMEFNGQELLETSHVTIPANAEALQRMKGLDQHPVIDAVITEALGELQEDDPDPPALKEVLDAIDALHLDDLDLHEKVADILDRIKGLETARGSKLTPFVLDGKKMDELITDNLFGGN